MWFSKMTEKFDRIDDLINGPIADAIGDAVGDIEVDAPSPSKTDRCRIANAAVLAAQENNWVLIPVEQANKSLHVTALLEVLLLWQASDSEINEGAKQVSRQIAREKRDDAIARLP